MLATLFKDERCSQLTTYSILEKMYLDQIIRRKDLMEFEAVLMDHQKAVTALVQDPRRHGADRSEEHERLRVDTVQPSLDRGVCATG